MKRIAFKRVNLQEIRLLLDYRTDWRGYGNIRGENTPHGVSGWQLGRLDPIFHGHVMNADYVVWSYATPIAWHHEGDGWIIPRDSYSRTTTAHQNKIRAALYEDYSES